jgi:hypothetical protein
MAVILDETGLAVLDEAGAGILDEAGQTAGRAAAATVTVLSPAGRGGVLAVPAAAAIAGTAPRAVGAVILP